MPQKRKRDGRVPLHKQKRVGIEAAPGFKARLVNDEGDRIAAFEEAGYRKMNKPIRQGQKDAADASQVGKIASQAVGGGVTGYYMEIPKDLYKQDQMEKQKENDETMRQIGHLKDVAPSAERGEVVIDHELSDK